MLIIIAAVLIVSGVIVLIDNYSENEQDERKACCKDMSEPTIDAGCNPYANNTETTINITSDDL